MIEVYYIFLKLSIVFWKKIFFINKIKSIIKKKEKNSFTSSELSELLNITERSTNRIIKKIIESGYASVEFENSPGAGRPRRKPQFNF